MMRVYARRDRRKKRESKRREEKRLRDRGDDGAGFRFIQFQALCDRVGPCSAKKSKSTEEGGSNLSDFSHELSPFRIYRRWKIFAPNRFVSGPSSRILTHF